MIKVMQIEDNLADAFLLQELLKASPSVSFAFEHRVRFADALRVLDADPFDLVLLDHNLPDVEGWDGLERLREAHPTLPVVVLSGNDDPRALREALGRGAQDYWIKGEADGALLASLAVRAVLRQAFWTGQAGGGA